MRKVLWFSNCAFSDAKATATGTWLIAMGEALAKNPNVEILNITLGAVDAPLRSDCGLIKQWILPARWFSSSWRPSDRVVKRVEEIANDFGPDLVHVWGTEGPWAAIVTSWSSSASYLIDMQGILFAYAEVFYGGLTFSELLSCIGIKEVLMPQRHLYFRKRDFEVRGKVEKEVLRKATHISVQSDWVRAHVEQLNPTSCVHSTGIILRNEFHRAERWKRGVSELHRIFTSSSGATSYKGLHVLFRAFAHLRKRVPNVELRVAGGFFGGRLPDGYTSWLRSEADRLGISESIVWLGPLSADRIVEELGSSALAVIPSYVETYCLALAEAMLMGVPSVVSFAGALPELATHNESALYFGPGDHVGCAFQMERIVTNTALAERLSNSARSIGKQRNNTESIVARQIQIYSSVLEAVR